MSKCISIQYNTSMYYMTPVQYEDTLRSTTTSVLYQLPICLDALPPVQMILVHCPPLTNGLPSHWSPRGHPAMRVTPAQLPRCTEKFSAVSRCCAARSVQESSATGRPRSHREAELSSAQGTSSVHAGSYPSVLPAPSYTPRNGAKITPYIITCWHICVPTSLQL